MKGLNPKIANILHYISLGLLFFYAQTLIVHKEWCTTHSGYVSILVCSHFMKMYSYTIINNDYREDYNDSKKND